jgi:hypothetical protein
MGFLALIPIKDWIYAAIIGTILISGYVFVHRCHAAEDDMKSINAQSAALLVVANAHIAQLTADHAKEIKANEIIYTTELKDNAAQHTADLVRLRQLDAYRQSHPDVARPGTGSEGSGSGSGSEDKGPGSFTGLGLVAAALADATRDLTTSLDTCTRDRDSLTGKP